MFFIDHIIVIIIAFLFDQLVGDPHSLPHPVVFIGKLIQRLEKILYPYKYSWAENTGKGEGTENVSDRAGRNLFFRGLILVAAVIVVTAGISFFILFLFDKIPWKYAVLMMETVMCTQILALKSLKDESMQVFNALREGDNLKAARMLSMIVGRDTDRLDEKDMVRAAVETVAEGCCDAVIAPLFYIALGGPVLGFVYKAVNTMDSMIGYKNARYEWFGKAAARLDDFMNFIPARIAGVFIIFSSLFHPFADSGNAFFVWRRDRHCHDSVNAGQTEAAAAGALNIRLGGDAFYGGILKHRAFIGDNDEVRDPEYADIGRINALVLLTAVFFVLLLTMISVFLDTGR